MSNRHSHRHPGSGRYGRRGHGGVEAVSGEYRPDDRFNAVLFSDAKRTRPDAPDWSDSGGYYPAISQTILPGGGVVYTFTHRRS
jgi:hypothetical protein